MGAASDQIGDIRAKLSKLEQDRIDVIKTLTQRTGGDLYEQHRGTFELEPFFKTLDATNLQIGLEQTKLAALLLASVSRFLDSIDSSSKSIEKSSKAVADSSVRLEALTARLNTLTWVLIGLGVVGSSAVVIDILVRIFFRT